MNFILKESKYLNNYNQSKTKSGHANLAITES